MSAPRLLRLGWLCYVGFVVYGSLLPFEFTPMPLEQAWLQFRHTPFLALGVDERADWVANGVLFALYHLHVPWVIPQAFVDICIPWAAKRYRSALVGIAVHSVQSVFFTVLVLALVLK